MPETARLEARATLDDANFQAGLNRMEARGKSMSDRMTDIFKRASGSEVGEIRAERALSGFVAQLTQGNIPGAIESITYRLTGLGLAAGVGIGAAVIVANKFVTEMRDVDKAVEKVQGDLARPIKFVAALGMSGIREEIARTEKDLEDLTEKRQGWFEKFREVLQRGQRSNVERFSEVRDDPSRVPEAKTAQAAEVSRLVELLSTETNESERLADIAERELGLSREGTKEEAARTEALKKRGQIELAFVELQKEANKLTKEGTPESLETRRKLMDVGADSRRRQLSAEDRIEQVRLQASASDEAKTFKPVFEKSQLSFKELLGADENATPRLSYAKHQAEMAQHEEQLGEGAKSRGDTEGAFRHFMEAERIKSKIPQLSDKDKMPEYAFKSALGTTEGLLAAIHGALEGGKQGSVDFANK